MGYTCRKERIKNLMLRLFSLVIALHRWKRKPDGSILTDEEKPVLEFIAIQRVDNQQWAIPGVSQHFKVFLFFFQLNFHLFHCG